MARPGTLDRAPIEVRRLIARRRRDGLTIDQLREELRAAGHPVSRSALGRHVQRLDAAGKLNAGLILLDLQRRLRRIEHRLDQALAPGPEDGT